jgi:hypothetical protein
MRLEDLDDFAADLHARVKIRSARGTGTGTETGKQEARRGDEHVYITFSLVRGGVKYGTFSSRSDGDWKQSLWGRQ